MRNNILLIGTLFAAIGAPANATIVTFDPLINSNGSINFGPQYTESGFLFEASEGRVSSLLAWATNSPYNGDPGGATLGSGAHNQHVTITKVANGLGQSTNYSLKSFDIGDFLNAELIFPGQYFIQYDYSDINGLHSGIIDLDQAPGLQTINLNLARISSFKLYSGPGYSQDFQIDNVDFSGGVPEPTTWMLLLIGFGSVGTALRGSRRLRSLVSL